MNYIHALHFDDRPDCSCMNKLFLDKYDTVEAFKADLELMLSNAIKFNGLDSEVGNITVTMCSKVHELLDAWRSGALVQTRRERMVIRRHHNQQRRSRLVDKLGHIYIFVQEGFQYESNIYCPYH